MELNPHQKQAVETVDGRIIIQAGAGSGKTFVLVQRSIYLVDVLHVNPTAIYLITFTRKAITEIKERVVEALGSDGREIRILSFHQLAHKFMRQYFSFFNRENNFTVIDADDSTAIFSQCRGKKAKKEKFPMAGTIQSAYSQSRNQEVSFERIAVANGWEIHLDDLASIVEAYEAEKIASNLVDLDDLMEMFEEMLQDSLAIRKAISSQIQYLMIDEYHDTNQCQARIVKLLTSEHRNSCAVGDENQSIYRFRGAFTGAMRYYREELFDDESVVVIPLEQNYRSRQAILDFANVLTQDGLMLESVSQEYGQKPMLIIADETVDQADRVAVLIQQLIHDVCKPEDICLLFRSLKTNASVFELAFKRAKIPYNLVGGHKILDGAHMRDFLAILSLCSNQMNYYAWHRALSLVEGIGVKNLIPIMQMIREAVDPITGLMDFVDTQTWTQAKKRTKLYAPLHKFLTDVMWLLDGTANQSQFERAMVFYQPICEREYTDAVKSFDLRWEEIESLYRLYQEFSDFEAFLAEMTINPERDEGVSDGVVMITIHRAKGLEFPIVFVPNANEGLLPSFQSISEGYEGICEEQRLAYVAVTRAQDQLYLVAAEYGKRCPLSISRFVEKGMRANVVTTENYAKAMSCEETPF